MRQHLKVYGIDAVGGRTVGGQNVLIGAAGVVPKKQIRLSLGFVWLKYVTGHTYFVLSLTQSFAMLQRFTNTLNSANN